MKVDQFSAKTILFVDFLFAFILIYTSVVNIKALENVNPFVLVVALFIPNIPFILSRIPNIFKS